GRVHRGGARRQLGAAAKAGAEAGPLGLGAGAKEAAALAARRPRAAHRPAVDAGGVDGDEEQPVEPAIPRRQGPVAGIDIDPHEPIVPEGGGPVWPFPDLTASAAGGELLAPRPPRLTAPGARNLPGARSPATLGGQEVAGATTKGEDMKSLLTGLAVCAVLGGAHSAAAQDQEPAASKFGIG